MSAPVVPRWTLVIEVDRLTPGRGVRALVDGAAVAVFALPDGSLRAVGDIDPCSGASVMSRGLTGSTVVEGAEVRFVASPLRKQRYALDDGRALDEGSPGLGSWPVQVVDGWVLVGPRGDDGVSSTGNHLETVR